MTSKEEAELLFKQQPRSGGPRSIPEYEQRALAERTKIAKLRVLRRNRPVSNAAAVVDWTVAVPGWTKIDVLLLAFRSFNFIQSVLDAF